MTRAFLLLAPLALAACGDDVPSWWLDEPCPTGEYTLSNLSTETQTCATLPTTCTLEQFTADGTLTEECRQDLCPDDLTAGIIVSDDQGEVTVDCEAPAT